MNELAPPNDFNPMDPFFTGTFSLYPEDKVMNFFATALDAIFEWQPLEDLPRRSKRELKYVARLLALSCKIPRDNRRFWAARSVEEIAVLYDLAKEEKTHFSWAQATGDLALLFAGIIQRKSLLEKNRYGDLLKLGSNAYNLVHCRHGLDQSVIPPRTMSAGIGYWADVLSRLKEFLQQNQLIVSTKSPAHTIQ